MGIRFRKSVKLGCFRINLSKSGVGYSFGFKGFRVTQTARNTTRTSFSIPGTGISYITEQSNKRKESPQDNTQTIPVQENKNTCNEKELKNEITKYSTSEGLEKIKSKVQSALIKDRFADLGIKFFGIASIFLCIKFFPIILGLILFILYRIYIRSTQLLKLDYEISEDMKDELADKYKYIIKATLSEQVWRITKTADVINSKYEGGLRNHYTYLLP